MKVFLEGLFDKAYPGLEKALDLTWRRNEAIASNVANAETPQYRAVDLSFGNELERAFKASASPMMRTNTKHLDISASGSAHISPDLSGATKADGNNVDIDIQMGQLAYNSGKFNSAARLLRKKLGLLKLALREAQR